MSTIEQRAAHLSISEKEPRYAKIICADGSESTEFSTQEEGFHQLSLLAGAYHKLTDIEVLALTEAILKSPLKDRATDVEPEPPAGPFFFGLLSFLENDGSHTVH